MSANIQLNIWSWVLQLFVQMNSYQCADSANALFLIKPMNASRLGEHFTKENVDQIENDTYIYISDI